MIRSQKDSRYAVMKKKTGSHLFIRDFDFELINFTKDLYIEEIFLILLAKCLLQIKHIFDYYHCSVVKCEPTFWVNIVIYFITQLYHYSIRTEIT